MERIFSYFIIFYTAVYVAISEVEGKNETSSINTTSNTENDANPVEISEEIFKKLMWKKCSNSSYVMCAKLALVHVIEKLDSSQSYATILPGVSLQKREDNDNRYDTNENNVVVGNDFDEALDRYLATKIRKYLGSLSLNVKLLDKNTIDDMRSWNGDDNDTVSDTSYVETGRGKKKYMQSLLMAGWMSGATLLALTVKSIAILSGKALLAALLSLMFTAISAFGKGGHYNAATKSTTYEIITKPIIAHSHTSDVQEAHGSDLNAAFSYKRSIPVAPEVIVKSETVPDDIEHLIRKVRDRSPYYGPAAVSFEYSKS